MEAEDEQHPTISNETGAEVAPPEEQPPAARDKLRDLRPEKDPMGGSSSSTPPAH